MVTLSAILQAPIQAVLRPSMWLPFIRSLHSHTETWSIDCTKTEFISSILTAVHTVMEQEDNKEFWDIHKVEKDGTFIRIFAFTRAEWLDVMEISYKDGHYEAHSFSSGVVPLIVPFAFICNLALFYTPFLDTGLNKERLKRLRDALSVNVTVV
ncbi:uncharacterized protein LOC132721372 [Ruditapes philippinarum]|uniref:uncharacterized protein LOC132721372 n=1 Tax=Ruditapes philippinarum TaxID=129788 RepID=UPI00295B2877|nr:uncharacterized protein LOC132721372 [Ruditapes philippinarum]